MKSCILYDSPEAASVQTVTGWVSADGRFCGDDEQLARYLGSTHTQCENESHAPHSTRGYCDECRIESDITRYMQSEIVDYEGGFIYCHSSDRYFTDLEDLQDYIHHNEVDVADLRLSPCDPVPMHTIDTDYWSDCIEEFDCAPIEIQEAFDALNAAIEQYGKEVSYYPSSKKRLDVKLLLTDVE